MVCGSVMRRPHTAQLLSLCVTVQMGSECPLLERTCRSIHRRGATAKSQTSSFGFASRVQDRRRLSGLAEAAFYGEEWGRILKGRFCGRKGRKLPDGNGAPRFAEHWDELGSLDYTHSAGSVTLGTHRPRARRTAHVSQVVTCETRQKPACTCLKTYLDGL